MADHAVALITRTSFSWVNIETKFDLVVRDTNRHCQYVCCHEALRPGTPGVHYRLACFSLAAPMDISIVQRDDCWPSTVENSLRVCIGDAGCAETLGSNWHSISLARKKVYDIQPNLDRALT